MGHAENGEQELQHSQYSILGSTYDGAQAAHAIIRGGGQVIAVKICCSCICKFACIVDNHVKGLGCTELFFPRF